MALIRRIGPTSLTEAGPGEAHASPKNPEKRWSIDLEKTIQEAHYADEKAYSGRYGFNPNSGRNSSSLTRHLPTPPAHGTSVRSLNTQ